MVTLNMNHIRPQRVCVDIVCIVHLHINYKLIIDMHYSTSSCVSCEIWQNWNVRVPVQCV